MFIGVSCAKTLNPAALLFHLQACGLSGCQLGASEARDADAHPQNKRSKMGPLDPEGQKLPKPLDPKP